ncbi:hypothetical protein TIFTF001_023246 [Ficus carica]|uniref:Uncharacterized protein n=1 Tax=Ficus carica TaxID=3494 RepID=A0AA88AJ81_FICCA|nr:hypothetical protein TIFTF001_023246 [Ficus carica]
MSFDLLGGGKLCLASFIRPTTAYAAGGESSKSFPSFALVDHRGHHELVSFGTTINPSRKQDHGICPLLKNPKVTFGCCRDALVMKVAGVYGLISSRASSRRWLSSAPFLLVEAIKKSLIPTVRRALLVCIGEWKPPLKKRLFPQHAIHTPLHITWITKVAEPTK